MPRKTNKTNKTNKATNSSKIPTSMSTNSTSNTPTKNNSPSSSIGSSISQGIGLGTGVAIGNTMANGFANILFGQSDSDKSTTQIDISNQNNCFFEYNDYKKCMEENPINNNQCKIYLEMLNNCRKNVNM